MKIRYFAAVAGCGSFSEAARRLYTSQPNLSKQIAQMEQELGFSLFTRSKRSLKLTPAGAFLYEKLKDLPDQLDDLFDKARALARREEDSVCIGVLEGQDVNEVLRRRLETVSGKYPNLKITLERSSYHHLRSGLRSGHYDLIITLSFDVEGEQDLDLYPLYHKAPAVVLRRDHPLAGRDNLTLWDLRDEPFVVISREESPGGYQRLIDSCAAQGFVPRIERQPQSLESLLLCVEMGIGVAVLDQNTRLELSPDILTIPQDAPAMAVVAVVNREEAGPLACSVAALLSEGAYEDATER